MLNARSANSKVIGKSAASFNLQDPLSSFSGGKHLSTFLPISPSLIGGRRGGSLHINDA
jgi:hypothetical protein